MTVDGDLRMTRIGMPTTANSQWVEGAPSGNRGRSRGAHLRITLPAGSTRVREPFHVVIAHVNKPWLLRPSKTQSKTPRHAGLTVLRTHQQTLCRPLSPTPSHLLLRSSHSSPTTCHSSQQVLARCCQGGRCPTFLQQKLASSTVCRPCQQQTRLDAFGRHFVPVLVSKSSSDKLSKCRPQDVYADLSGNVLLHSSIPALGLRASQWAVISWARPADAASFADSKFAYKCVTLLLDEALKPANSRTVCLAQLDVDVEGLRRATCVHRSYVASPVSASNSLHKMQTNVENRKLVYP